ncbi:Uncharacterised protein [Serratia marcescens]|uniref:Uncharacterized protein n=1 Tax=Serratia marcescens TaxID=615 RepID=A0A379YS61_SERMA|nr:hypothetical protein DP21_1707 [Serratia marcescens]CAI0827484.1 Uncharacterised protein [Serratia marcescens]CAI1516974.1 Uncharacterised protein [Serratia marcescens]SUI49481.1 Uncharacterised protein [Serratia marcescens]SUI51838.1 Uncharacterised protein [Serratia marcescens]
MLTKMIFRIVDHSSNTSQKNFFREKLMLLT